MRLVLRERGADQAWITVGSGDDAIRSESVGALTHCASRTGGGTLSFFFSGFGRILLIRRGDDYEGRWPGGQW
jgi:hypothetical protein